MEVREGRRWHIHHLNWITAFRGSIPMALWQQNFELLGMRETVRSKLLQQVFEDVMEGGVEVLLAYKANQRIQHAQH